jgi:hypothetical protein
VNPLLIENLSAREPERPTRTDFLSTVSPIATWVGHLHREATRAEARRQRELARQATYLAERGGARR